MHTWIGRAERMGVPEIEAVAEANGIPPLHLRAVLQVEALGSGYDKQGRAIILDEPHVLYRQLAAPGVDPSWLRRAVAKGVAYRRWGEQPYPKGQDAQYARLDKACEISPEHAVRACSWGLAQVLGENWQLLGFPSALAMVEHAKDSERNQLDLMIRFVKARRIIGALAAGGATGFLAFTRVYNGPGQAAAYTARIMGALAKLVAQSGSRTVLVVPAAPVPAPALAAPVAPPVAVVVPKAPAPKAAARPTAKVRPKAPVRRAGPSAAELERERQRTAELNDWALFQARNGN